MVGRSTESERLLPDFGLALKLVVPESDSIFLVRIGRFERGQGGAALHIWFVLAASDKEGSHDQTNRKSLHYCPPVIARPAVTPFAGIVGEKGMVGPALNQRCALASSAACRLTALAAATFCALIMATTNCLSI